MRPKGTSTQLAARRQRAAELLDAGQSVTATAKAVGVSRQTIHTWQAAARRPGRKRKPRHVGAVCRLKVGQQHRLERVLLNGAQAYGYASDHWTLERIGLVIFQLFGVRYTPSGVWHLMQRLGWSSQKTTRVALARDEQAVAAWRTRVWPKVKKVA